MEMRIPSCLSSRKRLPALSGLSSVKLSGISRMRRAGSRPVRRRTLQVGAHLEASCRNLLHAGFENLEPAFALRLCSVHGYVGASHQLLGADVTARRDRDADGRTHGHLVPGDHETWLEDGDDSLS